MSIRDSATVPASARVTPKQFFRVVAIAEAITWTLLIAGLLLKYVFEVTDLGVTIGGSIHGFVFLVYAATAVLVGINQRWPFGLIAVGVVTAVIPYATIPFDIWLHRRGRLDGAWRTDATDDPRDQRWIDRFVRWFLRHPVLLVTIGAIVVIAVFTVLLILGPPGEW